MKLNDISYFVFPLILILSLLFSQLTHPLSMGLILLIQTTIICISSGLYNPSFWFSYILFLIFLGGMLILFIYVASLASNEPFKLNMSYSIILIPITLVSSSSLFLLDPMILPSKMHIFSSYILSSNKINLMLSSTSMIYSLPPMFFTMFMILYLLLTLIVVVKIINISCSPLRLSKSN
uniref:NADH-ubiquinone oxidoreductase chain 6 n=1 Tax=Euastacus armatus TaxID=72420 RepID=A0A0C5C106_9EUCA|nr:NADH dehydrogenase subunit 6 [Euastacus armatus]AJN90576.1 NADH dehydrogenase subunit 6 [Euastacus armatus]